MKKLHKLLLAGGVAWTLAVAPAWATTNPATTTVPVSATVLKACTVTAAAMLFGPYTPTAGAVASTSTLSVACSTGTRFTMTLNGGTTAGGSIAQRLMTNGSKTLQYNLYGNAAHTELLGDGVTAGSYEYVGTGAGAAAPYAVTIYGNLPDSAANQLANAGTYTDTITVSVAY